MILHPRCFFAKFAASVTLDGVSPHKDASASLHAHARCYSLDMFLM